VDVRPKVPTQLSCEIFEAGGSWTDCLNGR
jgi:hypothetical protein